MTNRPDLDAIAAREQAATPGPWERGDVWATAGVIFDDSGNRVGPDCGTHCAVCYLGEPAWTGDTDINGRRMRAHRHRRPDPYQRDHEISGPDGGLVAGNYDYEAGGILRPEDAEFIVAARTDVPALLGEVRRLTAERDDYRDRLQSLAESWARISAERDRLFNERAAARREGAEQMREAAADLVDTYPGDDLAAGIRALPDTEQSPAPDACGRCNTPFDPADTTFYGAARYRTTPWCRRCVNNCHEGGADHQCPICTTEET